MTTLRLMEHMELIDRNQLRKDFSRAIRQWVTPSAEMYPPKENTDMEQWQLFKEVVDVLNLAITDDPAKRPTSLEIEQKLNQILINANRREDYCPTAYSPDLPTPVSEANPFLSAPVFGDKKTVVDNNPIATTTASCQNPAENRGQQLRFSSV